MPPIPPLVRLNQLVNHQLSDLHYKHKTKLLVLTYLVSSDTCLKSSTELAPEVVLELLGTYYPNWQEDYAIPPEDSQMAIRSIAERSSAQWVAINGIPAEAQARDMQAAEARRTAKKAENQQRNISKKQVQKQAPAALPTKRERRIFG